MTTANHSAKPAATSNQHQSAHAPGPASRSVAIIGAGPGGLAAAVLLAASGVRVTVFESQPVIGGRTARIRSGPFSFDRGPTFFMMPYVLDEIFAAAGRRLADYVELTRLDPMYRLLLGRNDASPLQIDATQNLEEMARRIAAIDPADGAAFPRFIADNRYKLRHSESILRNPMRSPLDLFAPATVKDSLKVAPVLNPHLSVHDLLSRYFRSPFTKLAVSFQSKYLGMSPYDCPSLFTILPFIEYEYGIWHPKGGCNALMDALAKLATELGAEIKTSTPVDQITFDGPPFRAKTARGVVVKGQEHRFDRVVVNADAMWAMRNLVPAEARTAAGNAFADSKIDDKRYSCSTFMLYLGVPRPVDLPHHTIYVSAAYQQNLTDITTGGGLSDDPSIYVCNPSRVDPTLAPPGKSALYVLVPVANLKKSRGVLDWKSAAPELRRRTFAQMSRIMNLDWAEREVEAEVMLTPDDWQASSIQFGATFNLAHNWGQMLFMRPRNKVAGFDNLFLVGGGTHPGSGLPTIFLSAQISARMICDELGLTFAGTNRDVQDLSRSRLLRGAAASPPAADFPTRDTALPLHLVGT